MKSQSITISISPKTAQAAVTWLRADLKELEQAPVSVKALMPEADLIRRLTQQLEGALEQADA